MPVLICTGPRVIRPSACNHAFPAAMSTQADAVGGHGLVAGSYAGALAGLCVDAGGLTEGLLATGLAGLSGLAVGPTTALGVVGGAPTVVPAFAAIIAVVARAAVTTIIVVTASPTFPRRNRISSR
jgi:hypothetical protein